MTAALVSPPLVETVPSTKTTLQLPVLKVFEGSSWHFCHHPTCQRKGIQPVTFYAVYGQQWRYFCTEAHVPSSLRSADGLTPKRTTRPKQGGTATRRTGRQMQPTTKASQCEVDILLALQNGPQAKNQLCAGLSASMTRIDTVLRRLWQSGVLTRVALGKRNTHLWYALVADEARLEGMVEELKKQIPVGVQRQKLLNALQDGPQTAQQLTKLTGFSIHKVMYTTQALHRMDRIASITSYADLNWFALPEDHELLVSQAWLASTDYRVMQFVQDHPGLHTRRIADTIGISFVRTKRILDFAKTFGRVVGKTSTNNHTSWTIVGTAALPLDLGTV